MLPQSYPLFMALADPKEEALIVGFVVGWEFLEECVENDNCYSPVITHESNEGGQADSIASYIKSGFKVAGPFFDYRSAANATVRLSEED